MPPVAGHRPVGRHLGLRTLARPIVWLVSSATKSARQLSTRLGPACAGVLFGRRVAGSMFFHVLTQWAIVIAFTFASVVSTETSAAPVLRSRTARYAAARKLFLEGNRLRGVKRLRAALAAYRRAYELYPSYKIDLNIAQTLFDLDRPREAAARFLRFFRRAKGKAPAHIVQAARAALAQIDARLGRLTLNCSQARAEVFIDGQKIGLTPLPGVLYLRPGRHRVELRLIGHRAHRESLKLAAGSWRRLDVTLLRGLPPRVARRRQAIIGWSTLAGGLTLAAGAATLYGVGIYRGEAAHERYLALEPSAPPERFAEARGDVDAAKRLLIGGHVLVGAGAIAIGVGLYYLLTRPKLPVMGEVPSAFEPKLTVGLSDRGVMLEGRF
ncbi:MAG: hypothetical protein CSA24_00755 [Deltaproteobacteria bacterium]|nr:MAG: hypothetical protein CSB49_00915 [Pseudomonadota bacterium]PIE66189.1 MAG: hypothetical protein CSA24_00755 [Deltaproteobacteria bacterium]